MNDSSREWNQVKVRATSEVKSQVEVVAISGGLRCEEIAEVGPSIAVLLYTPQGNQAVHVYCDIWLQYAYAATQ